MHRLRFALPRLILAALLLAVSACSDDDEPPVTPPEVFAVTISVVDTNGDPVPDLDLSLAPETVHYGEKALLQEDEVPPVETRLTGAYPVPFNPMVTVGFNLARLAKVRFSIEDVEGTERRVVELGPRETGRHEVVWNGQDNDENQLPSGCYTARVVVTDADTDELILDDTAPLLLAAWSSPRATVATTDTDGRIELTDRRLFPFLYGVEPFSAVDETGEEFGTITLTADTRFYLTDSSGNTSIRYNRDITGSADLTFVWNPTP